MINVSPGHLETIKQILAAFAGGFEVRIFGSRINGTAGDHSDLDLAFVGPDKMERRTKVLLKEAFEESALPFRVDVVDYNAISDEFRAIVDNKYEILQEKT